MNKYLKIFCIVIFFIISLNGATSGKISGRVIDGKDGKPLAGANVIIDGTSMGAATDNEGYFVILNVPPNKYNVIATYVGYAKVVKKGVIVEIGLTSEVDIQMHPQAFQGETVTVIAKRPVVKKDIAGTQIDISAEEIKNMPVKSIDEVISSQAGVEDGLEIRGSSSDELVYNVDGQTLNNARANVPYTSISLNSISAINIQTGAFNAEYENARSGVVNVVTKDGSKEKYEMGMTVRYSPPASKHFGNSIYDPLGYYSRPYNDDEVCWTGTMSETYTDENGNNQYDVGERFTDTNGDGVRYESPWSEHQQDSYPDFKGFNEIARDWNSDDNPDNDYSPTAIQKIYQYQHRRQGDITIPDYSIDIGFGGPVPLISKSLGNLRFFASFIGTQNAYLLPLSRDSENDYSYNLKLTSDLSPSMKLSISGLYGELKTVSRATWTSLPNGNNNFSSVYSVASTASNSAYVLYVPAVYNPGTVYRNKIGAKFTHQLSNKKYYNIIISKFTSKYYIDRPANRDTTNKIDIFEDNPNVEYLTDEFPYGYFGNGASTVVGMRTDWVGFAMDRSENSTTTLKGNFTNQINNFFQIKTGFSFIYDEYEIDSWNDHPTNQFWRYYNEWYQNPYRFGTYFQNKLEFKALVVNTGIRFDYSQANVEWFDLEQYDELLNSNNGFDLEEIAPKEESKSIYKLSPRLAISHPITENSKIYFNYGHFNALPQSRYRFTIDRLGTGSINKLGTPDLDYQTTIQYELGFEQSLFDQLLLKIAGYYKDIKNETYWTHYTNSDETVSYDKANSNGYRDVRGVEFTLTKRSGRLLTGSINYTYHIETTGHFGVNRIFEDFLAQTNYLKENPYISRPQPRPFANLRMNFHIPKNYSLLFIPSRIIGDWNLNLKSSWKAGSHFTYTGTKEIDIVDNVQWKDYWGADIRLSKTFPISQKYDFVFFADIQNVFNFKKLSYTGFSDYYDWQDYLSSLHFDYEEGKEHGNDRVGEYRKEGVDYQEFNPVDPDNLTDAEQQILDDNAYIDMPNIKSLSYLNPRKITIGVKINF
ncbi:MAG: TonB-dependent receptor [Candidatus Marinimicrobia bacterium]|nr:TonB-dependent receptor [Candidatus Neomarinimicrobiota bacterium]